MRETRWFVLGTIGVSLVVWSCGTGPSTGGTIETENLSRAYSVDSVVGLGRKPGFSAVVGTMRFDSTNFDFQQVAPDGHNLRVEELNGTPIPFTLSKWDWARRWARLQIRFQGALLEGGRKFRVTTRDTSRDASDSAAVWRSIPESYAVDWTSVLVDDFEGNSLRSLLPLASSWYTNKAESASITTPTLVEAGGDRTGNALRFDYNAPASRHDFVLVAVKLASRPVNFRSLDSIVFWAKGSAILSVSLDHQWTGGGSKTWMHNDLTSEWTRWRVRPSDFDTVIPGSTNGNLGWEAVHDSVTDLTFFATGATGAGSVMLDDIRIYGLVTDDFR